MKYFQNRNSVCFQVVCTSLSVRLCRKLKQALSLRQIGNKFSESHGFARPSWFKNVLHEHTYMHIQDIWQAADVSPDENRPCKIEMKRNMNKTVALHSPDDHEEDDQEGPAHTKQRRTNVQPTALKIVAGVMKKYTGTATKPAYAELEREARNDSEFKKDFRTPPFPIFTKLIHVTNMRNIWQWIPDGTLQDVHPEDLNTHGRELNLQLL